MRRAWCVDARVESAAGGRQRAELANREYMWRPSQGGPTGDPQGAFASNRVRFAERVTFAASRSDSAAKDEQRVRATRSPSGRVGPPMLWPTDDDRHGIRVVKLGDFKLARDAALEPPSSVSERFPPSRNRWIRRDVGGTWFAYVEEAVLVQEGKRRERRNRQRLYWLEGDELRRASEPLAVNDSPAFDRKRARAFLLADRGALRELSLEDGTLTAVSVIGVDPEVTHRVHALEDGRLLLTLDYARQLSVCEPCEGEFRQAFCIEISGDGIVVNGGVLLLTESDGNADTGGALVALAFGQRRAHVLARIENHTAGRWATVAGRARFYGRDGCFEVVGVAAAWAAFKVDPLAFPVYEGPGLRRPRR